MIRRGFSLVLLAAACFSACGGKIATDDGSDGSIGGGSGHPTNGDCPPVGYTFCPGDPPATADDIAQCNQLLGDPTCGSAYRDVLACAEKNVSCDPTTDTSSESISTVCGNQLDTFGQCFSASPTTKRDF